MSALPTCAVCPKLGVVRAFGAMRVRLCAGHARELAMSEAVPGEIERECSIAFRSIRKAS